MYKKLCKPIVGLLLLGTGQASALTIEFDYRYDSAGFFDAAKKDLLNSAADLWESKISASTLTPFTGGIAITNPVNRSLSLWSGTVPADTVIVAVGATSSPSVPLSESYTSDAWRADISGRSFGPSVASIAFNGLSGTWYVDDDPSTREDFSGRYDLYTAVLHELGHVLGYGISPDWISSSISGSFTGQQASDLFGNPIPLTPDKAHWQSELPGLTEGLISVMVAQLAENERLQFSDLDALGLLDTGWSLPVVGDPSPIPLPGAPVLFLSAMLAFFGSSLKSLGRRFRSGAWRPRCIGSINAVFPKAESYQRY